MVGRWGQLVAGRAAHVLVVGLLVVVAAGAYGSGVFASLAGGGFEDPESESARQVVAEQELFGKRSPDAIALFSSEDRQATSRPFRDEVERVVGELPEEYVAAVTTYYDTQLPDLLSTDGRSTQVVITLAGTTQSEVTESWDEVRPHLTSDVLDLDLAGAWPTYADVNELSESDLRRAELVSAPVVLALSLLIFGSLVAATMPLLVGVVAVLGGIAVVRLITTVTEVSVFSINVITLIGLGLAIDYALFIVSRFREELALRPADEPDAAAEAVVVTMATAGRTVLFSGLTVAAALSSLLVFPQAFLRSMAYGGVAAVVVAMTAALTILPATLRLLGRRVDAGRMPWRRGRPVPVSSDHGAWARIAHGVMRHPVAVMVVVTLGLLAVASPFLGVRWGSVDYRVLPADAPSYVAAERLAEEFGPERSTAELLVTGAGQDSVAAYADAVAQVPGVVAVTPVVAEDGAALLRAVWEGNSQTEQSQELLRAIREVEPAEGEVLVGGLTANTVDLLASIGDRLPWMGLIVVVVMLALLFVAFGSVVLPIKAVLMNVLSITASFGVVTWIFSDGNLEGLLGFESQGFLDVTQPILMLAVLFGLSMDYEVFLLSRVREQWDRTGDNTAAVATGVQRTGRIITSAALLLGVVIGAFSLSGIVLMKLIGIGMLVALLLDATVVRALLVPATMKLLGSLNWWAPAPMRSWWERYGHREHSVSGRHARRVPLEPDTAQMAAVAEPEAEPEPVGV